MNFKKSALTSAITLASFATGAAAFDASSWEVSGFVKNETAALQGSGTFIGQATSTTDTGSKNDGGDVIKFENTAKVFINGDVAENAALHAELNFVYDTETTPNDYQGHMNYSQNDYLREFYVDSTFGENDDIELRVGKQQVVWGTADGMKLLDIINPTDYREFAQNTMEDSRIPVWMAKLDMPTGETGSSQFIVSMSESNKIVGLGDNQATSARGASALNATTNPWSPHNTGDGGNPFVMKGVDTITGKVNGFLNIAPALGAVAQSFDRGTLYTVSTAYDSYASLASYTKATVNEFATNFDNSGAADNQSIGFKGFCNNSKTWAGCLSGISNNALAPNGQNYGAYNQNAQNMIDQAAAYESGSASNAEITASIAAWEASVANPTQMFHYMPDATFATFDAFVNMKSKYVVDHSDDPLVGYRFKDSTDSGLNYSLNFLYGPDPNPYIDMRWTDNNGVLLTETRVTATDSNSGRDYVTNSLRAAGESSNSVGGATAGTGTGTAANAGAATDVANLVMTEKTANVTNIGASFDNTVETDFIGPVVLRGEFLYQKDVMQPVIVRKAANGVDLNHGFLVSSVYMEEADMFKYVLGADITVATNMLVSAQFIQNRNLDFYDVGNKDATDWKYTGDMATMSLTNNLQKGKENKEFYSLFLSKPFGPSQLGRWNNITIYEEGDGWWNRFDVEYSFSDELIGSFELNNYWGDANTQFGQMEDSSNIQVGLKYLF